MTSQSSSPLRILFDAVITHPDGPDRDSTHAQFHTLSHRLIQAGHFIYWPVPERFMPPQMEQRHPYLYEHPNIQYFAIPQSKDRMREYNRIPDALEDLIAFDGPCWDWDVLVTMRTGQIPTMKALAHSPRSSAHQWTKRILCIEEMLILTPKPSVAQSSPAVQDRMTLEGYLAADQSFILSPHEKTMIMAEAKKHFSAARLLELSNKTQVISHLNLEGYTPKDAQYRYDSAQARTSPDYRKMNIAFVGRINQVSCQMDSLYDVFLNQWVMRDKRVQPMILTVSKKQTYHEQVPILRPPREEFHRMCREELDLCVYFYQEAQVYMSVLEPLSFGVPIILYKGLGWEDLVSKEYPFAAGNVTEAYAMVSAFEKDYAKQYARFLTWWEGWFVPTYTKRTKESGLYDMLMNYIEKPFASENGVYEKRALPSFVKDMMPHLDGTRTLDEVFQIPAVRKAYPIFAQKFDEMREGNREARGIVWQTDWNDVRLHLKKHGFVDGSVRPGHLVPRPN